ncbi:MAG: type II/IV secretion system ATPase subunit [Candidatus Micrarchaeota archaeon]|nr:type II/IV secretion system ATPase subunit [Candidatus Micrarchaeota archaeon]
MVFETEVKDGILRINCLGSIYGASLEDSEVIMAKVIDSLIAERRVNGIILAENREYEYDSFQTKLLLEIADAITTILRDKRLVSIKKLPKGCENFHPAWFSWLQELVTGQLRGDPIGAYVNLIREIRHAKVKSKSPQYGRCFRLYLENVLLPLKEILDRCQLIKMAKPYLTGYHVGDRSLYREFFHPSIRPNFMYTKYMAQPPQGEAVKRYQIGDVQIEIYKIPGSVRYFYHVIPPEFRLSEDEYILLDGARRILEERRPKEFEMKDQEKMREIFYNIGIELLRDLAEQSGKTLTKKQLEKLSGILTRYTAGLGILEVLLADEKVQDIYINSPLGTVPVFIFHADFEECETNLIPTRTDGERWATRFRLISGRPLDEANPVLDTETVVPGGRARVACIYPRLSPDGLAFALRRHRDRPWTFPLFVKHKFFDPLAAGLLSFVTDYGRTYLIAGTRSSGKTSLLGSCMLEIMPRYRIVTVEDTLELPVEYLRKLGYNIERLKSRSVITRVETELPAEEALRTALRLGDSCLIIGEVRSREAIALYEAMRIGALANVVAGTIHGESAYGVFDRVVNDLGVPPTSFKATDLVIICNRIKTADGLHTFRRVVEITEVRKHWKEDPVEEGGFINLMEYSAKKDSLRPTDILLNGESFILNEISKKIREWAGRWDRVWENINLRARIFGSMVEISERLKKPELLEAETTVASNQMMHILAERSKRELGSIDTELVFNEWLAWFKNRAKSKAALV